MNDTVKLIIELPKWEYEQACKFKDRDFYAIKVKAIQNGIPLDDVKAEIEQDGAYYQEIGEKERTNAYLEVLSTIDKCIGKAESEDKE